MLTLISLSYFQKYFRKVPFSDNYDKLKFNGICKIYDSLLGNESAIFYLYNENLFHSDKMSLIIFNRLIKNTIKFMKKKIEQHNIIVL